MKSKQTKILKGMTDLDEKELKKLRYNLTQLENVLSSNGYSLIETPILEPTSIFIRKSGGKLGSQIYSFIDSGGNQVSLRPEFTASTIRMFIDKGTNTPVPIRWQYSGPVFRFSDSHNQLRQFNQVGAELIGASGPDADAEILSVACQSLQKVGIEKIILTIGHIGVVTELIKQFDLSSRSLDFLIRSIADNNLRDAFVIKERAEKFGIIKDPQQNEDSQILINKSQIQSLRANLITNEVDSYIGRRSTKEILDRLNKKVNEREDYSSFEEAIDFVLSLIKIKGNPKEAFSKLEKLTIKHKLEKSSLELLKKSIDAFDLFDHKNISVNVDFSLVRDISYYSGIVFELSSESDKNSSNLAGGGRYDGLVRLMGGEKDICAMGFACSIEPIINIIKSAPANAKAKEDKSDE